MTERFMRIRSVRREGGGAVIEGTDEILGAGAAIAVDRLVGAEAILLRRDASDERARITAVSIAPGPSGERVLSVAVDGAVSDAVLGGTVRLDDAVFAAAVQRGLAVKPEFATPPTRMPTTVTNAGAAGTEPQLPATAPTGGPTRVLAAARMSGAIGEPARDMAVRGSDSLSFPPARVDVAGWPDALAGSASLPRALGALLGLAVGDALGTTNEFRVMHAPRFPELATGPVADIVGQGPFRLVAGQVTDDTQMAAALADHFWKLNMFTSGTMAVRYLAWLGAAFDVGGQIQQALDLVVGGTPPERAGRLVWEERGRFPAGNGSLMRTAVIGVLLAGLPDARRQAALLDSSITHFDPRCQLACAAFDAAIAHALTARPSPASMVRAAREEIGEAAGLLRARHSDMASAIDAAVAALAADLEAAREGDPGLMNDELHIHQTGGFVRVGFRLAFWELMHAPDFHSGVVDAANRGGDADTNAAIAGALLGAFHGVDGIPAAWIERVLTAPGVAAEEWDFHPRVFLCALAKGFGAQRNERALAQLAPFVAAGFPAYGPMPRHPKQTDMPSLATPALPLRPGAAMSLLADLLDNAGQISGFEYVTPERVLLASDEAALRVGSVSPGPPLSPDELARLPRAWLVAPPETVAGNAAAPAVSASFTACALWLFALRRHGPYAAGAGEPALAPVELPAVIPQLLANAVRAALHPDPARRVPASFIRSMVDMSTR